MHRSTWIGIALLVWLAAPASLGAGGFDEEDLSLRLPAAFSRFASYGDVAGNGGASAGSKWLSSVNPASAAWQRIEGRFHTSLSPQYSAIFFDEGTLMHVTTQSLTWDAGAWGTFQPALTQVRSNEETTRQGLELDFELDYAQIQWAKRFGQKVALGANLNTTSSELRFDAGSLTVSDSDTDSYGARLGALLELRPSLRAGVVLDYVHSPSDTTLLLVTPQGLVDLHLDDSTAQFLARSGISYEYKKDSALFLDYQFGSFSNDTGSLEVHRLFAGIDHGLFPWLFLRGGMAVDDELNDSWTVGLGIYPSDRFTLDIAYQFDMFPELDPELGRSQVLTFSLGFQL